MRTNKPTRSNSRAASELNRQSVTLTRPWLAASLVLLTAAIPAAQQPSAPRTEATSLRGRVVIASDGSPLPRVRLLLNTPDRPSEPVLTDDAGRFVLPLHTQPPATAFRMSATKPGFATTTIDVPRDGRELLVQLERGAAINGRVVDENGEPAVSALVIARSTAGAVSMVSDTDDLGEYRLGGLPAGQYTVTVLGAQTPEREALARLNERLQQNPQAVLPEPSASSSSVVLRAGEEADGIEVVVAATAPPPAVPPLPASLPPNQRGTAIVTGRVTSAAGRPLVGATVRAAANGLAARISVTDAQGRFTIAELPAGEFTVEARKTGYVTLQFGQRRASEPGKAVIVREDQQVERIDIALPGGTPISGTIVDDRGEPVAGVTVRALQLRRAGDLTMALTAPGVRPRPTDDRGRFRLFGLLPGKYLVSASADAGVSSPDPQGTFGYAPIFYPGTPDVSTATSITIDLGIDLPGVTMIFIPSKTVRVSGFAFTPSGQPARGVFMFQSQRSSRIMLEPRPAPVGPDGAFSFANVPPGEYVVQVLTQPGQPAGAGGTPAVEFGMQYVSVSDIDPAPLAVRATSGSTLEGRIVKEGGGSVEGVRVFLLPTDFDRSPVIGSGPAGLTMLDDGGFRILGATGARRFVPMSVPEGWYVKSVTVNGADALDAPFDFGLEGKPFTDIEVVVASDAAVLSGRAVDQRDAPVADYSVVVFSTDRTAWYRGSQRLKAGRPSQDNAFRVAGLPPGEYLAVAVDGLEGTAGSGEWQDPEFLEALAPRAQRVTLGIADSRNVSLRLIRR